MPWVGLLNRDKTNCELFRIRPTVLVNCSDVRQVCFRNLVLALTRVSVIAIAYSVRHARTVVSLSSAPLFSVVLTAALFLAAVPSCQQWSDILGLLSLIYSDFNNKRHGAPLGVCWTTVQAEQGRSKRRIMNVISLLRGEYYRLRGWGVTTSSLASLAKLCWPSPTCEPSRWEDC